MPQMHYNQCVRPRGCKELCALSLTCRALNDIAQPTLFHMAADLDAETSRKFAVALNLRPDLQRHVRQFMLRVAQNDFGPDDGYKSTDDEKSQRFYSAVDAVIESDSGQASLAAKEVVLNIIKHWMRFGINIMNMLPRLEDLYLMPFDFWYPEKLDFSDSLVQLCSAVGVRNAKRVHINMETCHGERIGYDAINTIIPHLRQASCLRLRGGESLIHTVIQPSAMSDTLANLTTLQLTRWVVSFADEIDYNDTTLCEILRLCTKLESFKISLSGQNYWISLDVIRYLQVCKDTLQELDVSIEDPPISAEEYGGMRDLLANFTKLQRLRLHVIHGEDEKYSLQVVDGIVPRVPSTVSTLEFEFSVDSTTSDHLLWKEAKSITQRVCRIAAPNIQRMSLLAQVDEVPAHLDGRSYMPGWRHSSQCLLKPPDTDAGLTTYIEGWRV